MINIAQIFCFDCIS